MPLDKKYYENNLSAKSADLNIIPRNDGGNLIEVKDKYLYIEPITYKYLNSTVNNVIQTSFQYYKFPSRIIVTDELDTESININDLDISDELNQSLNYRYKLSKQDVAKLLSVTELQQQLIDGTSNGRIRLSNGDIIQNSIVDASMKELNYDIIIDGTPQLITNRFSVTQDILDLQKDIQFNAQIALKFSQNSPNNNYIARIVQYDPDSPVVGIIDQQTSGRLLNIRDDIKQAYTKRDQLIDSIYASKNNLVDLKLQLDQITQQQAILLEQNKNRLIEFINSTLGSTQATLDNYNQQKIKQLFFDKVNALPKLKANELNIKYNELAQAVNNISTSQTLQTLQNQINTVSNNLKQQQRDLVATNTLIEYGVNPWELLRGNYGSLPGNNIPYLITFDIFIDQSDLKLNSSYAIELVTGTSPINQTTQYIPILLNEQSYWSITSI